MDFDSKNGLAQAGQYLGFFLGSQPYAIPIADVREINRMTDITSVPRVPDYVVGVMNLRGKVIPVIDLRIRFGVKVREFSRETCVIVVEGTEGKVGMIVDAVNEVVELSLEEIQAAPPMGNEVQLQYVNGVAKREKELSLLVDISRTLAFQEISQIVDNEESAA